MFVCQKNIIPPNSLLSHLNADATILCAHKKCVDNYNNHMVGKLFQNSTIYT
jgi:hypothetical protein